MKKTFKFFMAAAIVAAGFTACSDEVVPGPDPVGPNTGVEGEGTHATFSFNVDGLPQTKFLDAATGETTTVNEYRVLIFKNNSGAGALEVDTVGVPSQTLTIPMTSGFKRIFVIANADAVSPALLPAKSTAFTEYSQFNAMYDLSTSAAGDSANVDRLNNLYGGASATRTFVMGNGLDSCVYQLQAGVSAAESQTAGNNNNITINLRRAVAKTAITKTATSGPGAAVNQIITKDTSGIITDVVYRMWNLNRYVYPIQNFASGILQTPNNALEIPGATATYKEYFARWQGISPLTGGLATQIGVINEPTGDVPAANYYYIPENSPNSFRKGTTTYAAVEAVFTPMAKHYVRSIGYNESTKEFTGTMEPTANATAGGTFYVFDREGVNGIGKGVVFANEGSNINGKHWAKKVIYHLENPNEAQKATVSEYEGMVTDSKLNDYFVTYTNGKSYYRLNIGSGDSGSTLKYGVVRNNYYHVNITGFLKLGENEEGKLVEPENEILEGETNLTVSIKVLDWLGNKSNQEI